MKVIQIFPGYNGVDTNDIVECTFKIHGNFLTPAHPTEQENLKVPCNEGSEQEMDTIRISAYHYKAHQQKRGAALADTLSMAFAMQREDSQQLFGGAKPCVLCGSAGMTHYADHGKPVNCESKVLLGVAEFKVNSPPAHEHHDSHNYDR